MLADRVRMATFKDSLPKGYVLATDDDFSGTYNGAFRYIGSDLKIVIPNRIKGIAVTSYDSMFFGSSVIGVVSNNPNITNMDYMFRESQGTSLDLSNFDTSYVTDMRGMFFGSQATSLDLSSFNTSNVTDMWGMFGNSQATTLDLSSFNTSNVTDMDYMFFGSQATSGFARTQADADRFNATSLKPAGLTFIVKP